MLWASIVPEVFESIRRECCVLDCVGDGAMSEICLNRSRVLSSEFGGRLGTFAFTIVGTFSEVGLKAKILALIGFSTVALLPRDVTVSWVVGSQNGFVELVSRAW